MVDQKRKYELKKRAEAMADTRQRITEAALELHGTIGPARTTVSAVAERAGVQRHTLYRHFPTEADLFGACSAHYAAANPLPHQPPGPARRPGARATTPSSGSAVRWTTSTRTTSGRSRCSARSSGTPSSSR